MRYIIATSNYADLREVLKLILATFTRPAAP